MKRIHLELDAGLSGQLRQDLADSLYYVAEEIEEIAFADDNGLVLGVRDGADAGLVENKAQKMIKRFLEGYDQSPHAVLFRKDNPLPGHGDIYSELLQTGDLFRLGEGQYGLKGVCLKLLDFFDAYIREIGVKMGATEHRYPTLLPVETLQRISYFSSRPESLNYVSHLKEDMNMIDEFAGDAAAVTDRITLGEKAVTDCVNSSAVCFHTYHLYQDQEIDPPPGGIFVGAAGKCFRYESKNTAALERLRDFTMREIICLGAPADIAEFVQNSLEIMKKMIIELDLKAEICTANDPFFIKEFGYQAMFQKNFRLKYELKAALAPGKTLAVGSLNNHRDFLGKAFNIRHRGVPVHSSCLAFGLERCVYAFFCRYGLEEKQWPKPVKEFMDRSAKTINIPEVDDEPVG